MYTQIVQAYMLYLKLNYRVHVQVCVCVGPYVCKCTCVSLHVCLSLCVSVCNITNNSISNNTKYIPSMGILVHFGVCCCC